MTARRERRAALAALVLLLAVGGAACEDALPRRQARWRTSNCAPPARPAPLSLDAAREAYRLEERRHELRLREAASPGAFLRELETSAALRDWANGRPHRRAGKGAPLGDALCLSELAETGGELFEHEFAYADGLGSGQASSSPKGPFRRVHEGLFGGPETISCTSCHWVGGPNGAGAETDNAFLAGDGEKPASGDARNPQALIGLGVVELLAREMTTELQRARDSLLKEAAHAGEAREKALVAKGVEFGVLRAGADGKIDATAVRGVDADLVVKPFGWKGTRADVVAFSTEALQVHLGIQDDALVAEGPGEASGRGTNADDPDGDGVRGEFGAHAMASLAVHLALLELPVVEPLIQDRNLAAAATGLLAPTTTSFVEEFAKGREIFHSIGCASCHRPMLVLEKSVIDLPGLPPIDLARDMRHPALQYAAAAGGYPVWLFSDLKRHDMGGANKARHEQRGVPLEMYLTPRLWGAANSAPYLHDGRAPSFDYAIAGHDGEGAASRAAYAQLSMEQKGELRVYLMSLRRAPRVMIP